MATEAEDHVVLHQFRRYPEMHLPSLSSFCVKLETFLRVANISYTNAFGLDKSPKGKIPWVEFHGEIIGDSYFIMERLIKDLNVQLDANLSSTDHALAVAIQRICEDHLYFITMHDRWVVNWDHFSGIIFEKVPWMIRSFVASSAQSSVIQTLQCHGIGRHSNEEIIGLGIQDLEALSGLLGEKQYFLGDTFTSVDCTAFGHLVQVTDDLYCAALKHALKTNPALQNLTDYVERVKALVWPDWEDVVQGNK